jgi:hypothetical protein
MLFLLLHPDRTKLSPLTGQNKKQVKLRPTKYQRDYDLEEETKPTAAIYLQFREGIPGINTTHKIHICIPQHSTRGLDARDGGATLGAIWVE